MSSSPQWLSVQAAYLFRQAARARQNGNAPLAELLTEGACRCLDRIAAYENAEASAPLKAQGPHVQFVYARG